MTGMLYSLVALGFVLIFKASRACSTSRKGAMVLFAALAMARFSEWIPKYTCCTWTARWSANVLAVVVAMARDGDRWRG